MLIFVFLDLDVFNGFMSYVVNFKLLGKYYL